MLPCPWDSPGKNTGVGCHFLLQCTKVKSQSKVAQLCPTLSDLMDCSLPGSSIHGIFPGKNTGVGCHCLLQMKETSAQSLGWEDSLEEEMQPTLVFFGEGNGTPLQYTCLENPMDGGA